jgi:2-C-methyl-D-erythritol 4-phosphate cytidylyltransferase
VVPVVPVVETVRQLLPEGDSLTVSRDAFRLVQTPQAFRTDVLKKAYLQPYQKEFTDDASVVEEMGHPILLVEGNPGNIKLTTPEDLRLAEALCRI